MGVRKEHQDSHIISGIQQQLWQTTAAGPISQLPKQEQRRRKQKERNSTPWQLCIWCQPKPPFMSSCVKWLTQSHLYLTHPQQRKANAPLAVIWVSMKCTLLYPCCYNLLLPWLQSIARGHIITHRVLPLPLHLLLSYFWNNSPSITIAVAVLPNLHLQWNAIW